MVQESLFKIPLPEKEVDFNKYYSLTNDKLVKFANERLFQTKSVNWIGKSNRMMCSSNMVKPIKNNDMNYEKIYSVYYFLKSGNKINLRMPPAKKKTVSFEDISIHLNMNEDELWEERFTRRFTTGSPILDKMINYTHLGKSIDFEHSEEEKKMLNGIVNNGFQVGDIGSTYIELIDANHRSLGVILAGEKFIYYRSI